MPGRILITGLLLVLAGASWIWFDYGSDKIAPGVSTVADADECPQLSLFTELNDGVLQLPTDQLSSQIHRQVTVGTELTVSHNHNLGRYGQLTLSAGGRMHHPNNGTCLTPYDDGPRFLVIDDGLSVQNPDPVPFLAEGGTLRAGTTVTGLTGWLGEEPVYMDASGFSDWFVIDADELTLTPAARPEAPPELPGSLLVAGFNVENYFTSLGSRGARNSREFERQHASLVAALSGLDAGLIGLAELENDEGSTLSRLVNGRDGLAQVTGNAWSWVQGQGFGRGSDEIGLAFLYRSDMLVPVGPTLADTHPVHERPPLMQRFREPASGFEFTVVMTHLKSRGGCAAFDADMGDGCWNERRDNQVRQLLGFLDENVVEQGAGVLILGDLNSYALENPVSRIKDAGFTDLLAEFVPASERYTYVYQPGVAGYIDHALANEELREFVCGAGVWHINADEPVVKSWSAARFGPDLFEPDAFRSSDHDPVLVSLASDGEC